LLIRSRTYAEVPYLSEINLGEARKKLFADYERAAELSAAEQRMLVSAWRELDATEPLWSADFEDYMQMLLHVIRVAGVDHVCMGADWDGGGGINGLPDISALPLVTERLRAAGYSEADLAKIWGGNVLRVLRAAEQYAGYAGGSDPKTPVINP
jgi:membrane dipeptidase